MQPDSGSERYILCSDRTMLRCRCGEELILLGREEDWYSEGRTAFECHQCGGTVSLTDSLDEEQEPALIDYSDIRSSDAEAMSVRDLIRSLKAAGQ